ncbi:MAG: response regulator [Gemmatimonadales bacterium]|nr:response regulator [Gemmatimonadales bacterium]
MSTGAEPSQPATILVVDDEESLRALIVRMLRAEGYVPLEARDGRDALRVFDQHEGPIDLMLIDMVMPVMDGGRLAVELLRRRPEQRILCMSAYAPAELADLGLQSPDAAFLRKPFMPDQLYRHVRQALEV